MSYWRLTRSGVTTLYSANAIAQSLYC
jgi:hypothetical protein